MFFCEVAKNQKKKQKQQNTKATKKHSNNKKQDAKETHIILWFKTKQDNKQKKPKTKEHLETKHKQN